MAADAIYRTKGKSHKEIVSRMTDLCKGDGDKVCIGNIVNGARLCERSL